MTFQLSASTTLAGLRTCCHRVRAKEQASIGVGVT